MRFITLMLIFMLLFMMFSVSQVKSQQNYIVERLVFHADAVKGWNDSIPGPTVQVIQGDILIVTLDAHDHQSHFFWIDLFGLCSSMGFYDTNVTYRIGNPPPTEGRWPSEPEAPPIGNSTYSDLQVDNNYTFTFYPGCWGLFIVRPNITTFSKAYHSDLNSSNWDALADFDQNGIVDLRDLIMLGKLYSQRVLWTGELPPDIE